MFDMLPRNKIIKNYKIKKNNNKRKCLISKKTGHIFKLKTKTFLIVLQNDIKKLCRFAVKNILNFIKNLFSL